MRQISQYPGRHKRTVLVVKYACYVIGRQWRTARNLPVGA